ncbi:MAG: hypothetical protein ACI8TX_000228 [Hyphomicrobiaceae bacterium]|jgi:hypothetical protein
MAKRLQLNFHTPGPSVVDENGQARPCAMGVGWVNRDTLKTLDRCGIGRTDAWGQPIVQPIVAAPKPASASK